MRNKVKTAIEHQKEVRAEIKKWLKVIADNNVGNCTVEECEKMKILYEKELDLRLKFMCQLREMLD